MAEEPQTQSSTTQPQTSHWWQTMPAIMGGVATLLTAVTGLIVALKPSEAPQTSTPAVTPASAQTQAPVQNSVQPVQPQTFTSPSSPVEVNNATSNGDNKKTSKKRRRKDDDD